jgi:hypothetical protein
LGGLNGVVPPTGKRFASRQTHWFRVADGKLAEHRATRKDLPAMLRLGVVQPPGRPPSQPATPPPTGSAAAHAPKRLGVRPLPSNTIAAHHTGVGPG